MTEYNPSKILDLIIEQTKITLKEEFSVETKSMRRGEIASIPLKDYTSLIYVNGPVLYIVMMSFEKSILTHIANILMEEDDIQEDEEAMMYAGIASEMTNTFLGLAISKFPNNGNGVEITPPIIVDNILDIGESKNSDTDNIEFETNVGKLSINFIDAQKNKKDKKC